MEKLFCIVFTREREEPIIFHQRFKDRPTLKEVTEAVEAETMSTVNDLFDKVEYWEVKENK